MKKIILVFVGLFFLTACSGRVPSPKLSHKIIQKHFVKYGKKYKESDFGKHKLDKVEIGQTQEIQKNLAEVEAYVYLKEGPVYWVGVTIQKKPFGWKALTWETLGTR